MIFEDKRVRYVTRDTRVGYIVILFLVLDDVDVGPSVNVGPNMNVGPSVDVEPSVTL